MKFIVTLLGLPYLWFMRCLNCRKDIEQTEGKRRKLYCSPKCRVAYCRKKKPTKKAGRKPGRPPKKVVPEAPKKAGIAPIEIPHGIDLLKGYVAPAGDPYDRPKLDAMTNDEPAVYETVDPDKKASTGRGFDWYVKAIAGLEFPEDYRGMTEMINSDETLKKNAATRVTSINENA